MDYHILYTSPIKKPIPISIPTVCRNTSTIIFLSSFNAPDAAP